MEFLGVRGISEHLKKILIKQKGAYNFKDTSYGDLYFKHLKREYLDWAKENNIPEHLIEDGWTEYRND